MKSMPLALPGSVNVFPLEEDKINLTSTDTIPSCDIVKCVVAGVIQLTYPSSATAAVSMAVGDVYGVTQAKSISIVSGTFHVA